MEISISGRQSTDQGCFYRPLGGGGSKNLPRRTHPPTFLVNPHPRGRGVPVFGRAPTHPEFFKEKLAGKNKAKNFRALRARFPLVFLGLAGPKRYPQKKFYFHNLPPGEGGKMARGPTHPRFTHPPPRGGVDRSLKTSLVRISPGQ